MSLKFPYLGYPLSMDVKKKYMKSDIIKETGRIALVRMTAAILLLLTMGLMYQIYMETHFQIYDAALRFHVRAASDVPAEQQLKLKVRDKVLEVLRPATDRAESAEELKTEVIKKLPELARTAVQTLRDNDSQASVKVSISRERFPVRRYGNMFFPAGVYEALRVDIGPAQGHNWWCAIYPELCYNAKESSSLSEKGKKDVERDVSKEERQILFGEKGRFRIKILEWFSQLAF